MQNKIALFVSGSGTNAQALLEYATAHNIEVNCIICDNPNAEILKKELSVPVTLIPFLGSKKAHEQSILKFLGQKEITWIFLAGYMRILSSSFIDNFHQNINSQNRIVNIHPSLLPKYKGLNAYEHFYHSSDKHTGISIHFVDSGIDTGEIILQGKINRIPNENINDFIERAKKIEHELYPKILHRAYFNNY